MQPLFNHHTSLDDLFLIAAACLSSAIQGDKMDRKATELVRYHLQEIIRNTQSLVDLDELSRKISDVKRNHLISSPSNQ